MTHADYIDALERIHELAGLDPEMGTAEGEELLRLADECIAYERQHFPEMFDPVDGKLTLQAMVDMAERLEKGKQ